MDFLKRVIERKRKKCLRRAFVRSVIFHFLLIATAFICRQKISPEKFMEFTILEDSRVVSKQEQLEIRQTIKEIQNKKTLKSGESTPGSSRPESRNIDLLDNERFLNDFEKQIYRREQANIQIGSKQFNDTWDTDESPFLRKKKGLHETAQTHFGKAGYIRWKRGARRVIRVKPKVVYPLQYRKNGIQGTAKFTIFVDSSGNVTRIELIKGTGYSKLDVIARQALRKTKFNQLITTDADYDEGEIEVKFQLKD